MESVTLLDNVRDVVGVEDVVAVIETLGVTDTVVDEESERVALMVLHVQSGK